LGAAGFAGAGLAGAGLAGCAGAGAVCARKAVDPHHTVAINSDENSAPNRSEFISRQPSGIRNALPTRSIIIKYKAIRNEIGNVMAVHPYGRRDCGGFDVAEVCIWQDGAS
jgi:hypothetical protein